MVSPFPGMDPFIEDRGLFEDFHIKLIAEIERHLSACIPDRYVVRTAERPYIVIAEPNGKTEHSFKPDVGISSFPIGSAELGAVAVAEPETEMAGTHVSMRAFIAHEYRENFIEIYLSEPERVLVTCIEVLSPSNKRPGTTGWDQYMRKRQGLLLGGANLVEIDLLRGGTTLPMVDEWPTCPYRLLVARREKPGYCNVWAGHYRHALPPIPVPLVLPDKDLLLELQPMIDAIYARSRYSREIDYTRPLSIPLPADDLSWLAQRAG